MFLIRNLLLTLEPNYSYLSCIDLFCFYINIFKVRYYRSYTDDLTFKKEKDKSKGKILESKIVIAPVAAQMLWIDEMNYLTGVSENSNYLLKSQLKMWFNFDITSL
jgi:hypothetical protein